MCLKNAALWQALECGQHVGLDNVLYVGWKILKMRRVGLFFLLFLSFRFSFLLSICLSGGLFSMNANRVEQDTKITSYLHPLTPPYVPAGIRRFAKHGNSSRKCLLLEENPAFVIAHSLMWSEELDFGLHASLLFW